jgi:CheY-like chemotaxis protein
MARILIIEDYSDTRELTELILVDAGYSVVCADDGLAGLHCALHDNPDLILMDLNLPRMDGWQATRCLKGNPTTRHIPVIAFTAYATDETCTRALQAGCGDIITKPFDIDALLGQIADALVASGGRESRSAVGEA